jgi:hypothetical protein
VEFRQHAPGQLDTLRARTREYELLPVPVCLVEAFARTLSASDSSTGERTFQLLPDGGDGATADAQRAVIDELVAKLSVAIEDCDAAALDSLLAQDFRDGTGRTRADLLRYLTELGERVDSCRMIVAKVLPLAHAGGGLAAQLEGAWETTVSGARSAEVFSAGMRLARDASMEWRITWLGNATNDTGTAEA